MSLLHNAQLFDMQLFYRRENRKTGGEKNVLDGEATTKAVPPYCRLLVPKSATANAVLFAHETIKPRAADRINALLARA